MTIVSGVDGGGTRTRAVLLASGYQIIGYGEAGASNYGDVGIPTATANIQAALQAAWAQSGSPMKPVDAIFMGIAGVISLRDRDVIHRIARDLELVHPEGGLPENIGIDHDIRIALAGGLAGEPGIALIVGTGSSAYGRAADGQECQVGGWGYLLDDGGSGYFLGLQALAAIVRATDGRGAPTLLASRLLPVLDVQDLQDLMHRLYSLGVSRSEMAALAPLVLQAAQEGDLVAQEIVRRGVAELAWMVRVAAVKLFADAGRVRVVCSGGLVESSPYYLQKLTEAVQDRLPGANLQLPILPPVIGAALLAGEMLGWKIRSEQHQSLRESWLRCVERRGKE